MKILKIVLFVLTVASIKVNLELHPPSTTTQKPQIQNITVRKQELFTYYSNALTEIPFINRFCTSVKGKIKIDYFSEIPNNAEQQHEQFLYCRKYSLLYRMDRQFLIVYSMEHKHPKELSRMSLDGDCLKEFAFSVDEEYLFIFSCLGIKRLQTKTILTNMEKIQNLPYDFNAHKLIVIDDIFLLCSVSSGIRIYGINLRYELILIQEIKSWKSEVLSFLPEDIAYKNGLLYVLNIQRYIFIYERVKDSKFQQKLSIELTNVGEEAVNRKLQLWNKNIYIESLQHRQTYITQLQQTNVGYDLVRYYKNYYIISDWMIVNDSLMVLSGHTLNVYQINKDPRNITKLMNGLSSNHLSQAYSLQPIMNNTYMLVTLKALKVISIKFDYPSIACNFTQNGVNQLILPQPCILEENINDSSYFRTCTREQVLRIEVDEGEGHYMWWVLLVVFLCFLIIVQLIYWRKKKLTVIEMIVTEINKLKKKHEERIDFVQENYPPARESNWEDITEQKQQQLEEVSQQAKPQAIATQMEMQST